jgi:hypothetical protein
MNRDRRFSLLRVFADESGQAMPLIVMVTVLVIGMSGLSMDLGRAYFSYQELQASTDAAALAAGYAMGQVGATQATTTTAIDQYSSAVTGSITGYNVNPNLAGATVSAINFSCDATYATEAPCSGGVPGCTSAGVATGCNVVQVQQTAKVDTMFLRALTMFGVKPAQSLSLNASASALMRGAQNEQYNVAVILDSTGSMSQSDTDGNCVKGTSKEVCALDGVQDLLAGLTPCGPGSTTSKCASGFDSVAVFTFPNVQANTATDATTCTNNSPQGAPYSVIVPGTTWTTPTGINPNYQITAGYLDNYSATNAADPTNPANIVTTPANPLEIATGADTGKNCNGLTTPISGQGTYLAGAIYAAQSSLIAAQKTNTGSLNAIVLLTDGAANATNTFTNSAGTTLTSKTTPALNTNGTYPSMIDQCEQAISAAQYAATNGTSVYVIGYEAQTSGCTTDTSTYADPCTNLQKMALKAGSTTPYAPYFYSDATTANKGACTSTANPGLTLGQIFGAVATSFTQARLIPN